MSSPRVESKAMKVCVARFSVKLADWADAFPGQGSSRRVAADPRRGPAAGFATWSSRRWTTLRKRKTVSTAA